MDEPSTAVTVTADVVRAVELAVSLAVATLLALRWLRHRAPATAAAFGVFAVLAVVLLSAYWRPADTSSGLGLVWSKLLVCVLLAIPYLLVLFARVLGGLGRRTHLVLGGVYVAEVALTLAIPPLPDADDTSRPAWLVTYTVVVLAAWTVQSVVAATALWRSGRDQSSVVRHRMRSLSIGAVLLAVALLVSGAIGNDPPAVLELGVLFAGLVAILLFALAFLLPASLRLIWRQADLTALSAAERGLMTALTGRDVAATVVPVLAGVFGGHAVLLDEGGTPVRAERLSDPEVAELAALVAGHEDDLPSGRAVQEISPGVLAAPLQAGWLVVQGGRLAPVFGDDEAVLLARVATMVDLALQRVGLFEQEQASRLAAEAANAELETLLYSVSHDLRSPLISVLGYLDFLRAEHSEQLTGDGKHYLERISVNAIYMQNLISDLLELSRIGRTDPPADVLDLQRLAEQVADAARVSVPTAQVTVAGPLPRVRMSDVRARQLLTNLVDNALKHGGRDDLHVRIGTRRGQGGALLLEVADDGRGVPVEYRTRVLRVFERLDAPKSSPGTGMGLAICKRIAESLHGTIEITGPPDGSATGTLVRVTLPAAVVVADRDRFPRPRPALSRTDPVEENA
jgi:signal transduction histidine kinase